MREPCCQFLVSEQLGLFGHGVFSHFEAGFRAHSHRMKCSFYVQITNLFFDLADCSP